MKVSFIIPVYKVAGYIEQCAKSIISQTYKDFEILLVDDGSPDECPAICDRLAAEYSFVKALHKKNGGLSDARNYGLQYATGDYVAFVDSDDYWDNDRCLEQLVTILDENPDLDVLGYNFKKLFESKKLLREEPLYSKGVLASTDNNVCLYELAKQGIFPISACTKLIRREFLISNNIFFIKGLVSEDIPWYIDLMSKVKKCKYVNIYAYVYRQNVLGSITNAFSEKKFFDRISIIEKETKLVESRDLTKQGKDALYYFLAYEYTQFIANIGEFDGEKRKEVLNILKKYQWLLKYDLNYKVRIPRYVCAFLGLTNTARLVKLYNSIRR